ncbi:thioesterase family protein [Nocardioides anomalus]|uniref:Thioesterase family protein n=1 Tax=Nocardioides anomalus TaxID=2712223 RepID=A0A6G6WEN6_9ACTN|nr:thioesterase family protein [Nocardioides anomalus]QIG43565.1 thioesterase family protein [Nocardioides anomalus]
MSAYFHRTGEHTFAPTEHVSGAWDLDQQHVGPSLGLLTHAVEQRAGDKVATRLGFDILGVLPMEEVEVRTSVLRAGRTVELVEAVLSHAGRPAVSLRAWLMDVRDTSAVRGSAEAELAGPGELAPWDPTTVWGGGYLASAQVRRDEREPGRAQYWVRTDTVLLADEPTSRLSRAAALFDIANGMTVRESPERVRFPNVDLTAHLVRRPAEGWLGFDTTVTFGPEGHGLTRSVLHDEHGPLGAVAQTLTVRPQ